MSGSAAPLKNIELELMGIVPSVSGSAAPLKNIELKLLDIVVRAP